MLKMVRPMKSAIEGATLLKDASKLLKPKELVLLRQMGENGNGVNEIEGLIGNGKRSFVFGYRVLAIREMLCAPGDELAVLVDSEQSRNADLFPVSQYAPTAAPEIKHTVQGANLKVVLFEEGLNRGEALGPVQVILLNVKPPGY